MTTLAVNKKASFDYEILEKYEAGLQLLGFEVKAIKTGHAHLAGSYVVVRQNEAWLLNADIPPYQPGNTPVDYDTKRRRRLLLRRQEIAELTGKIKEKHLTVVPLRLYIKKRMVKIELGLGRGKKKSDKREVIKRREANREIERSLKIQKGSDRF